MLRMIHKYTNELTFVSFALIIFAFIFGGLTKDILLIVATVIAGFPIAIKAYQAIKFRTFSIEMLVTIAVIGALFIGEYVESAVVTFLFLFGTFLEGRTLEKTRASIRELTEMAPEEAVVIRGDIQETIYVDEVVKGDRIIIHPGSKIPVDGKVIVGDAFVNEATVTGESVPVHKEVNDSLFSGTIVDNGYMEMVAEKVGDDTTFGKIIDLVEDAQESKSKREKFLDKFANVYAPAVVVLAENVYMVTCDVHM